MSTSIRTTRLAATAAAAGFLVIAGFELLLALGVPWGRAAWGGAQSTLSPELRIGSAISTAVFIGAALLVLRRVRYSGTRVPRFFHWGTWVLVAALGLGTMMNLASSSEWERFMWAPVALLLAVLCLTVARGGTSHEPPAV